MDRNPYVPPNSPVRESPAIAPSLQRPVQVDRACTLLWWSFGLSVLSMVVKTTGYSNGAQIVGGVIGMAIGVAVGILITRWLTSKLKLGRNWMRLFMTIANILTYLILLVFWPFLRQIFHTAYAGHPVQVAISLVQVVLGLTAIVLINTPDARVWFLSMRMGGHGAA